MAADIVRLFLTEPDGKQGPDGVSEMGKQWVQYLEILEAKLSSLIITSGRSEARLWLSHAISSFTGLSLREKRELFVKLLKNKPTNRDLAGQVLQLMFQKKPEIAGSMLARKSHLLERFFDGHPKRILQWFSQFSSDERADHKRGAKALSQFAFSNRDICWEELDWKGKHGQSPVVVAAKPYYLLDLNIQRTIENFIDNVPEFWSSSEFSESLKDGDIISIDTTYFEDFFIGLLYTDESEDAWALIDDFLEDEPFSVLCRHLLIRLREQEFCFFLELLSKHLKAKIKSFDFSCTIYWLEFLLSKTDANMDELLIINSVINHGHNLLKMVLDEDSTDERKEVQESLSKIQCVSNNANSIAPLLNECLKVNIIKSMLLLGLQSWAIYCFLSESSFSANSWESIFSLNHIKFQKSKEYGILEEEINASDDEISHKRKRKQNRSHGKKKRNDFNEDHLTSERNGSELDRSWLLSTDKFSSSWACADLPEHLAKFCFDTWMRRLQKQDAKRSRQFL